MMSFAKVPETFFVLLCSVLAQTNIIANGSMQLSPCIHKPDKTYGGVFVDCRGQGLVALPLPHWLPPRTTTLFLQDNFIKHLDRDSFSNAKDIHHLSLKGNRIDSVNSNTFYWNRKLKILDLSNNCLRIDRSAFNGPWFTHLHDLVELRLSSNCNGGFDSFYNYYPQNLLLGLINLRTLTLDTFWRDLQFNGIFNHTKNLTKLVLSGGMVEMKNESFRDLSAVGLKQLEIISADNLWHTETGSFRYLTDLTSYSIVGCPQGMRTTLASLAPFVHRNFTRLKLNIIRSSYSNLDAFERDSVMSQHTARYLSQICVERLEFIDNALYFIEAGVLTSPLLSKCLRSVDFSSNPLLGERNGLSGLFRLKRLRSLVMIDRKYSIFDSRREFDALEISSKKYNSHKDGQTFINFGNTSLASRAAISSKLFDLSGWRLGKRGNIKKEAIFRENNTDDLSSNTEGQNVMYQIPGDLVYVNLNGAGSHTCKFEMNITILGGENLREVRLSDFGLFRMVRRIWGVESIRLLDISLNDGSDITPSFLSSFPRVTNLNMSKMRLVTVFSAKNAPDLFHALTALESLDLSHNGLHQLPSTTFSQNKNLRFLNLACNRFIFLPFYGGLPTNLHVLNIQTNSLLQLSDHAIHELEKHAKEKAFVLKLHGNVLSCGCSNLKFLHWFESTTLSFDSRNLSCILENGDIVTTTDVMKDLDGKWRQCSGKTAFLTSLILLSLTLLLFSLSMFGVKFKNPIAANIFQFFSKNFTPKTHRDYPNGVYIGYSDQDRNFVCGPLRMFIEKELQLNTYLRDRDLLPASDFAGSMVTAIHSSWRVLLVVSPSYLRDQWSYLAMKSAMYSVDRFNSGRLVIVLLSQDTVLEIPSDVLTAVRENNIIHLTDRADFTDSEKRDLTAALLP